MFWVREIGDDVGPSMETGERLERVFIGVTSANIDELLNCPRQDLVQLNYTILRPIIVEE